MWLKRPPPLSTLDSLVKSVRCLRELRIVLQEKMLRDFVDGVDIYLGVQRDVSAVISDKREVGFYSGIFLAEWWLV